MGSLRLLGLTLESGVGYWTEEEMLPPLSEIVQLQLEAFGREANNLYMALPSSFLSVAASTLLAPTP
jgi:hypothetical protein